jgi:hypothetical protein
VALRSSMTASKTTRRLRSRRRQFIGLLVDRFWPS